MKLYVHSLVEKLKRFYENARCYNKIYSKNFINNFNQLNMFRATISPILRSTSLCLQLVVYIYYVCICVCLKKVGIFFFLYFSCIIATPGSKLQNVSSGLILYYGHLFFHRPNPYSRTIYCRLPMSSCSSNSQLPSSGGQPLHPNSEDN